MQVSERPLQACDGVLQTYIETDEAGGEVRETFNVREVVGMARFPRSEAEVIALAQALRAGLEANGALFPSPPVGAVDLAAQLAAYGESHADAVVR